MTIKKLFSVLVLAFAVLFAPIAQADQSVDRICIQNLALAAASDNQAFSIAPYGGATLLRVACYTDANATTPATVLFEDGAGNATTGTATCAENGGTATWAVVTAGNTFVEGEALVYDVTNAADLQTYTICADIKVRE